MNVLIEAREEAKEGITKEGHWRGRCYPLAGLLAR